MQDGTFYLCTISIILIFADYLLLKKRNNNLLIHTTRMKKIILVLGIILLGIGCNTEQEKMDKMNKKILARITNVCQLSPDQVTKISPITENFIKLRIATKDKYGNNEQGFKNAMEANRKSLIDTLQKILTPNQFEKLKASFQQQKNKNGQGGDQEGGGGQE
jgi:hypothetical protein